MRRRWKILGWTAGAVIGVPALAIGALLAIGNLGGAGWIASRVTSLTNGQIAIEGLAGRFPTDLRIAELALRDPKGTWLQIDNLRVDWSPFALLRGVAHVARLDATRVVVLRQPEAETKRGGSVGLPVGIDIDAFRIDRLELPAKIAGKPAALAVQGDVQLGSLDSGHAMVSAQRLGAPGGRYEVNAKVAPEAITARIAFDEPAQGLIANLAGLPDLGALKFDATFTGPRNGEQTRLALTAGPLHLEGQGKVNLTGRRIDLTLTGSAPAMRPAPQIAWRAASLTARVRGAFTTPEATGRIEVDGIEADGATASRLTADIQGSSGKVTTTASLTDLRIPGPRPDLLAGTPLTLRAVATLDAADRPVTFTLSHPLLRADGRLQTAGVLTGGFTLDLPALRPFASLADIDLDGDALLSGRFASSGGENRLSLSGAISAKGGDPTIVRTIGADAKIDVAMAEHNGAVRIDQLALEGKAIRVTATGSRDTNGMLDLGWDAALPTLSTFAADVKGMAKAQGRIKGSTENLALTANATVDAAVGRLPRQTVKIGMQLTGLPEAPSGQVTAQGQLADAPLRVAADVIRAKDGAVRISIERGNWKSAALTGLLTLPPGATLPLGRLQLRLSRLADIQPLLGEPLSGSLDAQIETAPTHGAIQARLDVHGAQVAVAGMRAEKLVLGGAIDRIATDRTLALNLTLDGIHVQGIGGDVVLSVRGPAMQPALRLSAVLSPPGKGEARIDAAATAALTRQTLTLESLQATYRGQTAHLVQPARLNLANGVAIDDLRLRAGQATMAASGRITPTLSLKAAFDNVSAGLLSSFASADVTAEGTISADADLGGTLASPSGTIRVSGRGLRGWSDRGEMGASLDATARLQGGRAAVEATLTAGKTGRLAVKGTVPLSRDGALDVVASGSLDLIVFDPFLTAEGRRVRGETTLDLMASGTLAAPRLTGTIRLRSGEVQDYVQGIHIADIAADIAIADGVARITQFTGRAGEGTVALAGTVDLLAPGIPVDVTFTAHRARLPARDLVTAILEADLHIQGRATERLQVGGTVHVDRADIQLPDALPKSVAVLDVRRPGQKPPPPPSPAFVLGLDVTLDAPSAIFVRGHGLDAEMGGSIRVTGTTAVPSVTGAFSLRHGSLDFASQTLQFVSGAVSFDGRSLTGNLDPTINFVAAKTSGGVTARIAVTGYADNPKISLSSTPELPQDEVLAHLLFARSVSQLSPLEIAQIGSALASLASGGGGGFSPLAEVRKGLGLDVLSVGGTGSGTGGTTVEAGKYVANGVFLGSKQSLSGGTRAELKVDLTKHLKLETELSARGGGPITGASPGNDPGSSVGLTYEFEY